MDNYCIKGYEKQQNKVSQNDLAQINAGQNICPAFIILSELYDFKVSVASDVLSA